MKFKVLFSFAAIVLLVLPVRALAGSGETKGQVTVFYFYTNARCPSCLDMERWTGETLKSEFADLLENGVLVWSPVNLNGKGNYHYIKDYKLYTKSVILSEEVDGREVRWKNLDKVWELLRDETKFRDYVRSEVRGFLGGP